MTAAALAEAVLALAQEHPVPGVAIGVGTASERVVRTQGVSDVTTGLPVRPETCFQVGSVSKAVAALTCVELARRGAVDLDRPVAGFQDADAATPPTLRTLLGHVSGLVGELTPYPEHVEDVAVGAASLPRVPSGTWGYSSTGYALVGAELQRLLRTPFATLVRDVVLEPAGLAASRFDHEPAGAAPDATGHMAAEDGTWRVRAGRVSPAMAPAGGLRASAPDLLALGDALLGRGPWDATVVDAVTAASHRAHGVADAAGLGWMHWDTEAGWRLQGHAGATEGQHAVCWLLPEQGTTVVVLTNSSSGAQLVKAARDLVLAHAGTALLRRTAPAVGVPLRGTFAAGDLHAHFHGPGSTLTVPLVAGLADVPLRWTSPHDFVLVGGPYDGSTGRVERDAAGAPRWVNVVGRVLVPAPDAP